MEKMLINNTKDLKKAIDFFGSEWEGEIKAKCSITPCVLIGHYSEDVEYGFGYDFASVSKYDFEGESGVKYY